MHKCIIETLRFCTKSERLGLDCQSVEEESRQNFLIVRLRLKEVFDIVVVLGGLAAQLSKESNVIW